MSKKAMVVLLFILALSQAYQAYGYACVSYQDCPRAKCSGSVRQCIENTCTTSPCIVPGEEDILPREQVEGFDDAVKPYEKGINLSVRTKNPTGVKNSIIGALGLQKVLAVMLRVILIIFIALFIAMFFVFIKGKGLGKLIVIAIIIALVVLLGITLFSGTKFISNFIKRDSSWNTIDIDDFIAAGYKKTEFGKNQMEYLSKRVLNAAEYIQEKNSHEASILIIEIDDSRFLKGLRLSQLRNGKITRLEQEYIMESNYNDLNSYVFDEDRFVFIVTADKREIKDISAGIIKEYPGPPTSSRLFSNDLNPPVLSHLVPGQGALTNTNRISFYMQDNESGIDEKSLRIRGIDGFRGISNDCIISEGAYHCSFNAEALKEGANDLEIEVKDIEGNAKTINRRFVYDDFGAELAQVSPQQNSYTSSNKIFFRLTDTVSGIDIDSLSVLGVEFNPADCNLSSKSIECSLTGFSLVQGRNVLSIAVSDMAGNSNIFQIQFYYDTTPPDIMIKDYYFEVSDNLGISALRVNSQSFSLGQCSGDNTHYYCNTDNRIRNIYAEDKARNSRRKEQ